MADTDLERRIADLESEVKELKRLINDSRHIGKLAAEGIRRNDRALS